VNEYARARVCAGGASARRGRLSRNSMERSLSSAPWLFNPASVRSEITPGKRRERERPGIMRYKSWAPAELSRAVPRRHRNPADATINAEKNPAS